MTHLDMPAAAGHDTPEKRKPADEAVSQQQTTTDADFVPQSDAERKALETLRAEATLPGREVIALSDGEFPGPIRPGANSVGWTRGEFADWLASRIAQRDDAAGRRRLGRGASRVGVSS